MIIVLSGAPGAGKGTQGDLLAERCGFRKISTGDALRNQVKLATDIGRKAGDLMAQGKLVPDDVLFEVLRRELGDKSSERILLDGYPRNVSQAGTLESLKDRHPVVAAVHLEVPRGELIARLSGRRVCSQCGATYNVVTKPSRVEGVCDNCGGKVTQRSDDNPEKVSVRLDVYQENTEPVFAFYKQRNLYHKVDGSKDTEVVYAGLKNTIEKVAGF